VKQQVSTLKPLRSSEQDKPSAQNIIETDNLWCNQAALNELFLLDSDLDFMTRLVKGFTQDAEKHIECIRKAIVDDYPKFRESLHALKGAASELGAEKLSDICREGETYKPYDIGTKKLSLLINDIEYAYKNTVEALNNALSKAFTDNKSK
jgi:two-component system sensor histidine kinase RpfC